LQSIFFDYVKKVPGSRVPVFVCLLLVKQAAALLADGNKKIFSINVFLEEFMWNDEKQRKFSFFRKNFF
jgi:hypothetical protein